MIIVIDTREQQPWSFPPELAKTVRAKLSAGDYSLAGDEHFSIERKSLDDLVGTLSTGWDRFQRELVRMDTLLIRPKTVIVEGTWMQILQHQYNHPVVSPRFVRSQLARLAFQDVQILFADNAHAAAGMAWGLFYYRMKMINEDLLDDGTSNSNSRGAQA